MYDLPAMVDYVLGVTGHLDLHFVGHSMGATVAVVMLSERPQYNDKLKITILLAPVVKLQHNTSIFRHSAPLWKALQVSGKEGITRKHPSTSKRQQVIGDITSPECSQKKKQQPNYYHHNHQPSRIRSQSVAVSHLVPSLPGSTHSTSTSRLMLYYLFGYSFF
jgi:pimeloyl-ACP methyl ester carboxylesterase